jgi:hypothetical protein
VKSSSKEQNVVNPSKEGGEVHLQVLVIVLKQESNQLMRDLPS